MNPKGLNMRKQARRLGMQALYQWLVADNELNDIEKQFQEQDEFKRADSEYFSELLRKIPENKDQLSGLVSAHTSRAVDEIDPVELAVLYIALYELKFRIDIPYKVVINEAVMLAKKFGASEGHKYVNGILDNAARELRSIELQSTK